MLRSAMQKYFTSSNSCHSGSFFCAALGWWLVSNSNPVIAQPDKSSFHLFNPTPRELMRPLAADRPDATESPITVDAGHVQIETSLLDYTWDDTDGIDTESYTVLETNLKIGILDHMDLQFIFSPYGKERIKNSGNREIEKGAGDFQLRAKINLWGNNEQKPGNTALGMMPYITIPTGGDLSTDKTEGGLIVMMNWNVAENWGLGFQVEGALAHDDDDNYGTELSHTAVLGFDVTDAIGAYVEYLGIAASNSQKDYLPFFSGGFTWAMNDDLVLDAGTMIGLVDEATDARAFAGMTVRF